MSSTVYTPDIFEKEFPQLWALLMKILNCSNPIKIINDSIKYANENKIPHDLINRRPKFVDKIFLSFLFNMKKLVKTCIRLPIPPTIIYDNYAIYVCRIMKVFNTFIIRKNWTAPQKLLELINIPKQTIHYGSIISDLRLFPHTSHSRPIKRIGDALAYANNMLIAEPDSKIKLIQFKDIFKPLPITRDNELISVIFHESRRHVHALPFSILFNWFTTITDNAVDVHFIKYPYSHAVLEVSCPICKENSNDCTNCKDHNDECTIVNCNKCKCKKSHSHKTLLISMHLIRKIITLFPRENHSLLPSNQKFTDAVFRIAKTSKYHHMFTCSTIECKYATKPYIMPLTAYCIGCAKSYKEKKNTTFHAFKCPSCKKDECGLCGKLKIDHKGETLICPKKIIHTPEEITNARAEGIRFCPMCDVPTMVAAGCDHITCVSCREHWCFACERHLPINSVTGTRYSHVCTGVPVGPVAWTRDEEPLPLEFRMTPETNPAIDHIITSVK